MLGGERMEQRIFSLELNDEVVEEKNSMKISGIVNAGNFSKELGVRNKFYERIEKGTWERAIKRAEAENREIKLLLNHDGKQLMASTKNGSLELREIDGQLHMNATLCNTSINRDVYTMISSKLVDSFSFGFSIYNNGERWEKRDGKKYRVVTDINLFEVSCLSDSPAYEKTEIYARSMEESEKNIPDEIKDDVEQKVEPKLNGIKVEVDLTNVDELLSKLNEVNKSLDSIIEKQNVIKSMNEVKVEEQPKEEKVDEVKSEVQVEEVKPEVQVEEVKPEVKVEEPKKVDLTKHLENIKKLTLMKGE